MGWAESNQIRDARRAHHARRVSLVRERPAGWTEDAFSAYLDDPDGGRAACRLAYQFLPPADSTPTAIEILSQEM